MPDDSGFTRRADRIHPADIAVGARIRARRKAQRLSQQWLAAQLGITFQQVQKYERGKNRISASKLVDTAQALNVSVAYFFDGVTATAPGDDPVAAFMASAQGLALARALMALRPDQRVILLTIAEDLAATRGEG